jgi:hypothetical protein
VAKSDATVFLQLHEPLRLGHPEQQQVRDTLSHLLDLAIQDDK